MAKKKEEETPLKVTGNFNDVLLASMGKKKPVAAKKKKK